MAEPTSIQLTSPLAEMFPRYMYRLPITSHVCEEITHIPLSPTGWPRYLIKPSLTKMKCVTLIDCEIQMEEERGLVTFSVYVKPNPLSQFPNEESQRIWMVTIPMHLIASKGLECVQDALLQDISNYYSLFRED